MQYPRKFMSLTELVNEMGMSRVQLENISRIPGRHVVRTSEAPKAKKLFVTDELDHVLQEISGRRR